MPTKSTKKQLILLKRTSAFGVVLLALSSPFVSNACTGSSAQSPPKKVIVLGFDGMDPKILRDLVQEEKLPNFKRLMETGDFKVLRTSIPPQSPVAWSNFITGMNPGGHGIFDFIHRDPETILPYLSTSRTEAAESTISLGKWIIPLSSGKVTLLRRGKAFWETLSDKGIPATVFRVPANFPSGDAKVTQLSGMGTPDIQGTYGTFSFYTDDPDRDDEDVSGGKVFPVKVVANSFQARLLGPKNSFVKGTPVSSLDFKVFRDAENPVARIVVEDQEILLNEGEWSDWVKVSFDMIPFIQRVSGICRFYLKEVHPQLELYVTPINIDPSSPALPISTPHDYSRELSEEVGLFYTQGIPEDTNALDAGVLTDEEFLEQTDIVFEEELRMLDYELSRFEAGLLFFYIGRVDQLSHTFWRSIDSNHPVYEPQAGHGLVIEEAYQQMDQVLGQALDQINEESTLIVLSDHGFAPFYRAFNLNTWLKNEGYISLIDQSEGELLQNVDWARTRAYGLGFNGLYLNLAGREKTGTVRPGEEATALLDEISSKLLEIRDPKTGEQVILKVYQAAQIYTGRYVQDAPDLVIGYDRGYRAGEESVLGQFPNHLFRDNAKKWSGDHLIAAELVPGILLSNKKITAQHPALHDIAPTILAEFGIPKPEEMTGNNVF